MSFADTRPKTGEEQCSRTLDRTQVLANPMHWSPIESLLSFLDQSLGQLFRRRELARPLLAIRGSSARLLSGCLVDADDAVPPASCYAAFTKETGAEHPETETDESKCQWSTPAHVGAEDEVSEDHDAK